MEVLVERKWFTGTSTIGELSLDGVFKCFTLEDVVRPGDILLVKVAGETAIAEGTYTLEWRWSQKHQTHLPGLVNVPNFTNVEIHAGNRALDTEGCILVGRERDNDTILHSRDALDALLPEIRAGIAAGPARITLVNKREAPPIVA